MESVLVIPAVCIFAVVYLNNFLGYCKWKTNLSLYNVHGISRLVCKVDVVV